MCDLALLERDESLLGPLRNARWKRLRRQPVALVPVHTWLYVDSEGQNAINDSLLPISRPLLTNNDADVVEDHAARDVSSSRARTFGSVEVARLGLTGQVSGLGPDRHCSDSSFVQFSPKRRYITTYGIALPVSHVPSTGDPVCSSD